MTNLEAKINNLVNNNEKVIIAIDGPCGAGKSTLGKILANKYNANLFHMDDFFLRPEQRNCKRLSEPGGNVDYERFMDEVLNNIIKGFPFRYKPYNCSLGKLDVDIEVLYKRLNIVEGVYSLHPKLTPFYDIKIFIKVPYEDQITRIKKRDSSKLERFIKEWIPLEEKYFSFYNIEKSCDYIIDGITLEEI